MRSNSRRTILFLSFAGGGPMYSWPRFHYQDELARAGFVVDNLRVSSEADENDVNKSLRSYLIKDRSVHLIVSSLDDRCIGKDFGALVSQYSIPSVLICFDNLSVPFKHKHSCHLYDLVWLTSWETSKYFRRWGARIIFLPYAANPRIFRPHAGKFNRRVCFLGTPYGARKKRLNLLAEAGVPVKQYGAQIKNDASFSSPNYNLTELASNAWQLSKYPIGRKALAAALKRYFLSNHGGLSEDIETGHLVGFPEIPKIYNHAGLCLNITELWNTYYLTNPIHKLHLRTFEIPMSGGIALSPRIPELEEYYDDGHEAVFFSSEAEMIDRAKFFLSEKRDRYRDAMKLAARRRSMAEHTWSNRFNKVFSKLNLKLSAGRI